LGSIGKRRRCSGVNDSSISGGRHGSPGRTAAHPRLDSAPRGKALRAFGGKSNRRTPATFAGRRQVVVHAHIGVFVIIQPGAAQLFVIQLKPSGDQVQLCPGMRTGG